MQPMDFGPPTTASLRCGGLRCLGRVIGCVAAFLTIRAKKKSFKARLRCFYERLHPIRPLGVHLSQPKPRFSLPRGASRAENLRKIMEKLSFSAGHWDLALHLLQLLPNLHLQVNAVCSNAVAVALPSWHRALLIGDSLAVIDVCARCSEWQAAIALLEAMP